MYVLDIIYVGYGYNIRIIWVLNVYIMDIIYRFVCYGYNIYIYFIFFDVIILVFFL